MENDLFINPGILEWGIALVCAFIGGTFAKKVEYQSKFSDQYYFLKDHRAFVIFTSIYGIVAIIFLFGMFVGLFKEDIGPNVNSASFEAFPFLRLGFVGFLTGYGSKAILDVPLYSSSDESEDTLKLSKILNYFYPYPEKDAEAYINDRRTNYFSNSAILLRNKGKSLNDLYDVLDKYLRNMDEYKGQAGGDKYRIFFEGINQKSDTYQRLIFIVDNLGRKNYENILMRLGIDKIPINRILS